MGNGGDLFTNKCLRHATLFYYGNKPIPEEWSDRDGDWCQGPGNPKA